MKIPPLGIFRVLIVCLIAALCLHTMAFSAVASEGTGNGRTIYDTVLRWLNFAILMYILIRFGKDPIRKFFASQTAEVARKINRIEAEKKAIEERIADARQALEESQSLLENMKERIVKEGEKKREAALAEAQRHSAAMLGDVERKVDIMLSEAKATIRAELIDAAIALAAERLPKLLTETDNRGFVRQFLSNVRAE